ncbi:hypothetical protein [Nannocystis pusilla]|uniref:hypothetical protein n=1 Tax=Nannocystis pusilla TaxID=889268 RepID=UPI003B793806
MTRSVLVLLGLVGVAPAVHAAGPVGAVTADCAGVAGWAQDPDAPATTIDVHLYFDGPAGSPTAVGVPLTANQVLAVGCRGEQCQHGFHGAFPSAASTASRTSSTPTASTPTAIPTSSCRARPPPTPARRFPSSPASSATSPGPRSSISGTSRPTST